MIPLFPSYPTVVSESLPQSWELGGGGFVPVPSHPESVAGDGRRCYAYHHNCCAALDTWKHLECRGTRKASWPKITISRDGKCILLLAQVLPFLVASTLASPLIFLVTFSFNLCLVKPPRCEICCVTWDGKATNLSPKISFTQSNSSVLEAGTNSDSPSFIFFSRWHLS